MPCRLDPFTYDHRRTDINADDHAADLDHINHGYVLDDEPADDDQPLTDFDWAYSYAEAVARHFDDPAPLLLAHAAGLDLHALALDSRAQRCRDLAETFRVIATPGRTT